MIRDPEPLGSTRWPPTVVVPAADPQGNTGQPAHLADARGHVGPALFGSREGLLVEVIRAVEGRQRAALAALGGESGEVTGEMTDRFWQQLRSPELAPQERLFFEVYGRARQGRPWATPMLEGVVEDWVAPVAAMLRARGASPETARAVARLQVAVGRGLLIDVLATGEDREVDAAMRYFYDMLLAHPAASGIQ